MKHHLVVDIMNTNTGISHQSDCNQGTIIFSIDEVDADRDNEFYITMQCPSHNETIEKTITYYVPNISVSDFTLNLNLYEVSDLLQTLSICIIPDDESNFNIDDYRISIEADGITKEVDSDLDTNIDVYRQEYDVDIRVIVENKNNTSLIHEDIITLPQLDEPYINDYSWEDDAQYNIDLSIDGGNGNMEIICTVMTLS